MPFDPLAAILAGQAGRQQFDKTQAQQNLAQAAGQPGFNASFSPEMQQAAAFSSDPSAQFAKLGKQRQQIFFDDAQKGLNLAKAGKWDQVSQLANSRIVPLLQSGGDPSDSIQIAQAIENQDFEGAKAMLQSGVDAGIQTGFLKDPREAEFRRAGAKTAATKDWDVFQGLIQKAKESGNPEDEKRAEQFGRRSNFIKNTEQQSADIKITAAEKTAMRKAAVKRKQGFINSGIEAADNMANIRRSIDLLKTVKTGGIDNVMLMAKQLFGVEGADELELSSNLGKNVLAQLKPIFGSAFTAAEGKELKRLEAKFGSSTAGNMRLLKQVLKITDRAARRGLAAAEDQEADFTAQEIRDAMAFKLDSKDFVSEPVLPSGVSEDDINTTMKIHGMTREQVLSRLGGNSDG